MFWEVVGLERGPPSLVSTFEDLLGRKSSGSGLESRDYGRRDPSRWPRGTLYPQKLALTSPTSGGRSVGVGRPRTQATVFVVLFVAQFCSGRFTSDDSGTSAVRLTEWVSSATGLSLGTVKKFLSWQESNCGYRTVASHFVGWAMSSQA
jgi:hypothetical protein